jgi:hypothetical protein
VYQIPRSGPTNIRLQHTKSSRPSRLAPRRCARLIWCMWTIHTLFKNCNALLYSRTNYSYLRTTAQPCTDIFSARARPAWKPEVDTSTVTMKYGNLTSGERWTINSRRMQVSCAIKPRWQLPWPETLLEVLLVCNEIQAIQKMGFYTLFLSILSTTYRSTLQIYIAHFCQTARAALSLVTTPPSG